MNHSPVVRPERSASFVAAAVLMAWCSAALHAQGGSVWGHVATFNKQTGGIPSNDFRTVNWGNNDRIIGRGRCCGDLDSQDALQRLFGWTADVVNPAPSDQDWPGLVGAVVTETFTPTPMPVPADQTKFAWWNSGQDPGNPGNGAAPEIVHLINMPGGGGIFPITGTVNFFFWNGSPWSFSHISGNGHQANGQTARFTSFYGTGTSVHPGFPTTGAHIYHISITGPRVQNQGGGIKNVLHPHVKINVPGGPFTVGDPPDAVEVKYK